MEDRLLTMEETSERLRTPISTLRFWRNQSTGPRSARLGRRIFYRESEIAAWVEQQFTGSKAS
jgi:predicted DNA-binding transcriptional regulator AlpA